MNLKSSVLLLNLLLSFGGYGQTSDSASLFRPKTLEGYFICIRDTIPKTDSDVTSSRYDFLILFFDKLNDSLLQNFNSIKLSTPGYTLLSGGISYDIANRDEHRQYINYLIKENLFDKAHKYGVFKFDSIDKDLVNSNKSFISVFKGKLMVVGPFSPYIKLIDVAKQDLYMYLPNENNCVEYICSIIY